MLDALTALSLAEKPSKILRCGVSSGVLTRLGHRTTKESGYVRSRRSPSAVQPCRAEIVSQDYQLVDDAKPEGPVVVWLGEDLCKPVNVRHQVEAGSRSGYLEIALHASGVGDFNCSDDDPEHEKQRAEEQEPSADSLDSALLSGPSVSPRHELTSGQVCSKNAMGKCLVN